MLKVNGALRFGLLHLLKPLSHAGTGELGYDGPLYDGFLYMTDDMHQLGPSPMYIKYSSYVYDGFCIGRTNFPGPIESVMYPSSPVQQCHS